MLRTFVRGVLSSLLLIVLAVVDRWRRPSGGRVTAKLPGRGRPETVALPADGKRVLPPEFTRLLLSWLVILLLGGAEFATSFLPMARTMRPLVMIPGVMMVAVVAISFMEVGKGPAIVRGFAVAAMFWLIVLLGLGSMDPLTRTDHPVPGAHVE